LNKYIKERSIEETRQILQICVKFNEEENNEFINDLHYNFFSHISEDIEIKNYSHEAPLKKKENIAPV
jgi:hypothetical protein